MKALKLRILIPAALVLILGGLCWVHVPRGHVGIRIGPLVPGHGTVVGPGWRFRLPGLVSIHRYPFPRWEMEGTVAATTREGIPIEIPYRFSLQTRPALLLDLWKNNPSFDWENQARTSLEDSWKGAIQRVATGDLFGPKGQEELRQAALQALEPLGIESASIEVGTVRADGALEQTLLDRMKILHNLNRSVKILLIGWDGADWGIIDPLIEAGRMPRLAKFREEAAWGKIRSGSPTLSPLLWTTVATGKRPEDHGIVHFLVRDPATGRAVPITSRFRRVKALWNIFTDFDLTSTWIAWWATWPAERIQGQMITDRFAYSLFPGIAAAEIEGLTYPEDLLQQVETIKTSAEDVGPEDLAEFVHLSPEEIRTALATSSSDGSPSHYSHPVQHLGQILASTETYHRAALHLMENHPFPNLFAVYYQGIDEVCHRFAHFLPPRMEELTTEQEYLAYRDTVLRFYSYMDRLLGELLDSAPTDTYVLLLSDHGFAHENQRPRRILPFIEGKPGKWHNPFGIYLFKGPGIEPGRRKPASLYQVAPTLLALAGLPLAADMPGDPLEGIPGISIAGRGISHSLPVFSTIPSYEGRGLVSEFGPAAIGGSSEAQVAMETEMLENLRSLGYIGGGEISPSIEDHPEAGTVLYHANLAALWMRRGKFEKSHAEYRKALELEPESVAVLTGLSELALREGDTLVALDWARRAIAAGLDVDPEFYLWTADLYLHAGLPGDGRDYFLSLYDQRRGISEIAVALGKQLEALEDSAAAERYFWSGLEEEPACISCLEELFDLLDRQGRIEQLEEPIRTALKAGLREVMSWNWLGLIAKRQKRFQEAEAAFRTALEEAPYHPGTLANLGGMFYEQGRYEEAVEVLGRGLEEGGWRRELLVNFLLALGEVGRIEEAGTRFRDAEARGVLNTAIYNAMAYSYYINRLPDRAEEMARKSLELDPEQPEVRDLLSNIRSSPYGRP